jgi:hypothetical protein
MVLRDLADSHFHPQGDDVSLLIGHGSQQSDTHHLDGVLLCNVSTHPPGLDTEYGFWAFDQAATGVA